MNKVSDVYCIGLVVANLPVRPVNKDVFDIDVNLVDAIELFPGGDAMNEAITLAKLGVSTGLIGKVGKDNFGEVLIRYANEIGVDTANVIAEKSEKTSVCVVLIDKDGKRNFLSFRGANNSLCTDDIDFSILRKTKIINIGSIFALPMLDRGGLFDILSEAVSNHVITAADMKYDSFNVGFNGIKNILPYIDYLMPSYDEAAYLTNETDPSKMAGVLQDAGARTVVIKLGKDGCYVKSGRDSFMIKPFDVNVVDTTGAGDNFVAGFLTGVLQGWELKKTCIFANAVASISVQKVGATAGIQSMDQVLDFISMNSKIINGEIT